MAEIDHRNARWLGEESKASLIFLRGTPLMAMPWAVVCGL